MLENMERWIAKLKEIDEYPESWSGTLRTGVEIIARKPMTEHPLDSFCQIVLCFESHKHSVLNAPFVVWEWNMMDGALGTHHGDYYNDIETALAGFKDRMPAIEDYRKVDWHMVKVHRLLKIAEMALSQGRTFTDMYTEVWMRCVPNSIPNISEAIVKEIVGEFEFNDGHGNNVQLVLE